MTIFKVSREPQQECLGFPIAVRPLCGASNRNTSGSAGGYLLKNIEKGQEYANNWKSYLKSDSFQHV
jgi:hypothetical protein